MGVIKRNKAVNFTSSDDAESIDLNNVSNISFNRFLNLNQMLNTDPNNLLNPVISSEDEQTGNSNNLLQLIELELRRSRRPTTPKKRRITRAQPSFVCLGIKGKSDKKRQRFENANLISNPHLNKLINDGDIYKEIDIYDFVPKTVSPFALLLMDQDNMETWNEFVNLSEDEQDQVLNEFNEDVKPKNKYKKYQNLQKDTDNQSVIVQRSSNRASCSKKCFDRIDNCLKSFLRKKGIALTLMESIENELINNFSQNPTCIYLTCLDSSYARLLLHAVSQYHNLRCHSFDQNDGRWSRVQNKLDYFEPSMVSLTAHLENLYFKSSKI